MGGDIDIYIYIYMYICLWVETPLLQVQQEEDTQNAAARVLTKTTRTGHTVALDCIVHHEMATECMFSWLIANP